MTVAQEDRLHRMVIADPTDPAVKPITWNGAVEDREAAKRVFDEKMGTSMFLAYATVTDPETGTRKHEHIREFDPDVEQITLTPQLQGG